MKIYLLSDIHLHLNNPPGRKDDLSLVQFDKLKFILQTVKEEDGILLQSGDFFETPRSWYLLPKVMDLLKEYSVPIFCVFGQHDTYMYSESTRGTTNLGILEKAGLVRILGKSSVVYHRIHIYGCSWGEKIPRPLKEESYNILVAHYPVSDKAVYPGHDYFDMDRFLRKRLWWNIILVGDIHRKFFAKDEERFIVNTGCVLRRKVDKYNFGYKPGFFELELTDDSFPVFLDISEIEIPHRPSEEVLDRDHIERKSEVDSFMNSFIDEISKTDQECVGGEGNFKKNLTKFIKDKNINDEVKEILFTVMEEK